MKQEKTPKEKLADVYDELNIRKFAPRYFNKSGSWLHHKFDRVDVNRTGKPQDFTAEELEQLRAGLYDLAERFRRAADTL